MTDPFEEPPAIRQIYTELMDFRQQTMTAISHLMSQINRQNTLFFAHLQEHDLVEEITCPECLDEWVILRTLLKNLPTECNNCPVCGYDFDTEQASIDDFGSYVNEEE